MIEESKEVLFGETGEALEKRLNTLSFKEAKTIFEGIRNEYEKLKREYNSPKPNTINKEHKQLIQSYFKTLSPLSVAKSVDLQFYVSEIGTKTLKHNIEELMEDMFKFTKYNI